MLVRKGLVTAAAAVLALGSAAWADDASVLSPVAQSDLAARPLLADDAAAPARLPLMYGLDKIGAAKPLDNLGINIHGFVEGGYLYDTSVPGNISGQRNIGGDKIAFAGGYKGQLILDQADLQIERDIVASKDKFDIGFKVEGAFGRDMFYTHSNGILDQNNKHGGGPNDQLDLLQAYITLNLPIGNGLLLTAGKFVTPMGYEVINPTGNQFFTHSYLFTFGIPLTQTGLLATYAFSDTLTVTAGATRGWNQSTDDNNGQLDGIAQFIYKASDKLTVTGNFSFGPEGVLPYGPGDNKDWWFVPELIGAYKMSDQLTLAVDALYGYANHAAQWYSVAAYAGYSVNKYATLNGRIEWYNDGRGFTTGSAGTTNFYEATAGVALTPFPDNAIFQYLTIRPEVRYDWADRAAFDGIKFDQLTAAVDAVMQF